LHNNFDGGIYANNPSAWGMSLATLRHKFENIILLSLGTGTYMEEKESSIIDDFFSKPSEQKDIHWWQKLEKKALTAIAEFINQRF
jgi:patatin-like phospholipase/acyl hydrolase